MPPRPLLHEHQERRGPSVALPGGPATANLGQHGLGEVNGTEFLPQKEKDVHDDLRRFSKKGCWRRLLFRIRHRGDHPPANRGQALDLQDARRRRLPLHGPGPVSLLGRRRVGDFELGSFASRSLHGDTAGCLDQQQLRDGHLRGIDQRDRRGLRWEPKDLERL